MLFYLLRTIPQLSIVYFLFILKIQQLIMISACLVTDTIRLVFGNHVALRGFSGTVIILKWCPLSSLSQSKPTRWFHLYLVTKATQKKHPFAPPLGALYQMTEEFFEFKLTTLCFLVIFCKKKKNYCFSKMLSLLLQMAEKV